jgi:ATP-dependent RNA helicase MSS116
MTKRVLKSDYQFFTVVSSISESTLQNIEQFHVSALLTDHFRMACSIVDQTYNNSNKIIIFIPTANMAEVYYECLSSKHEHVWVQHARQSQAKRQHVYESFRDCEHGLLVCTDLVARGMDFPSVSIVIQVGVPIDRETYIHRVGRTGRAKASGTSFLIISKEEEFFLYQLKGIPIKRQERKITVDHFQSSPQNSEAFYVAWLGYYKAQMKKMGFCPDELVHTCNLIVQDLFKCDEPPSIDSKTITKLGLRGCSEIRSIGKK